MESKDKDRYEELVEKIMEGLDKTYQKLLETAKRNNEELVILKDNKIVRVKPQDLLTFTS
jgi:GTP cyclohydrolase I